jgi:hypothetical protein
MTELDEHIETICTEAGLEVMVQVFQICLARGQVTEEQIMALAINDVTDLYWGFIGPAIDRTERLIRDSMKVP